MKEGRWTCEWSCLIASVSLEKLEKILLSESLGLGWIFSNIVTVKRRGKRVEQRCVWIFMGPCGPSELGSYGCTWLQSTQLQDYLKAFIYLVLAAVGLCRCMRVFCGCSALASHYCRERAWECGLSSFVGHGLSCSEACGIFQNQGSNPCPLHWQVIS